MQNGFYFNYFDCVLKLWAGHVLMRFIRVPGCTEEFFQRCIAALIPRYYIVSLLSGVKQVRSHLCSVILP